MAKHYETPEVDKFMLTDGRIAPLWMVRELQDEFNVNLHSDGTGDEFLDGSDDALEGLEIVEEDEFFERFTEDGAVLKQWETVGVW